MATIKISNLRSTSVTRIESEEELLKAVSDSVAQAIKARGIISLIGYGGATMGYLSPPPVEKIIPGC